MFEDHNAFGVDKVLIPKPECQEMFENFKEEAANMKYGSSETYSRIGEQIQNENIEIEDQNPAKEEPESASVSMNRNLMTSPDGHIEKTAPNPGSNMIFSKKNSLKSNESAGSKHSKKQMS